MSRWVAGATAMGLVVRLALALLWPIAPVEDAAAYDDLATRLARGDGYVLGDGTPTAFRPPGYPLLLAATYRLVPAVPTSGRVSACIVGTAVIPLVGALGGALAGPGAGAVAAVMAALYPPFVSSWFSPRALLSEVLLTTLIAAALALAWRASWSPDRAVGWALLCGLVSGYAILTKGTAVFLPALFAGYVLCSTERRWGGAAATAVLVGAGMVVLPWTLRNAVLFHAWVPVSTNGGISLWASYNPASRGLGNGEEGYDDAIAEDDLLRQQGLDEFERSDYFFSRATSEMRDRPRRATWLVARKTLLFWDPTLKDWSEDSPPLRYNWAYAAMLPLAFAGLIGPVAAAAGRLRRLLVLTVALFATMHIVLHTDVRYRVPIEPLLIVLAAVGTVAISRSWPRRVVGVVALAWLGLHWAIGSCYEEIFAFLSIMVRGVGLG